MSLLERRPTIAPVRRRGPRVTFNHDLGGYMLYWAAVFFIIAIIAAVLGFGSVAGTASSIAVILFWVFVVLFIVSLLAGVVRRPRV